ncbi:LysE family translocator [Nonomuraea muscovyensis]|jgi:threonine/homoserine/homoserine lactone efflux protein|uniref:Threonine/homoserine/homoserine lactone efflux protein n=1 Tax=Nonomuraea muscovyensis TaxID=1124761 RepID=A0A7X0CAN3_9ACTN|nr:LysE family translocator [Nonomuraea muscovyensis]MBB6349829.1 threonine/homoserine/homoserine lactone efflux protein [Nonomuraea muscovyensis]MDF2707224.1 LysE family translocator [Nonomuraea muscovyensis]
MDIAASVGSFAAVVALLTLTPGLDTALILRTSLLAGRRPAWGVVLGIQAGTLLWGLLAAVGLSTLLAASQLAYDVLRWAGAAYLVWMGARMLLAKEQHDDAGGGQEAGFRAGFRRGLVTNLLNPKVGAFYVAMLPQFIPQDAPHAAMGLLLAGVHVGEGLVWSAVLIGFATLMSGVLRTARVRRALDRVTGVVIVGFGLRLALDGGRAA